MQINKDQNEIPWYDFFIIKKSNPILGVFNILIAIMTIVGSFTYLHISCFAVYASNITFEFVLNFIFGFDILLEFFTEFERDDGYHTEVIRSPKLIALNYLKNYFIIDFIAFFPFYEVFVHNHLDEE